MDRPEDDVVDLAVDAVRDPAHVPVAEHVDQRGEDEAGRHEDGETLPDRQGRQGLHERTSQLHINK
ncbi:hypothetical protein [Haloarcula regularis]|uniref:hypothetical protein n=1 Tax=Haloarcula regularis TaxID=3033392 RepID=UPI0023E8877B|nr:hypothetical protein [Halomicroarcula sp. SYNS111]